MRRRCGSHRARCTNGAGGLAGLAALAYRGGHGRHATPLPGHRRGPGPAPLLCEPDWLDVRFLARIVAELAADAVLEHVAAVDVLVAVYPPGYPMPGGW